jgi:hypothetical protein
MFTITYSFMLLAFVVAGPLVDHVFGALLQPGGGLAGSVGSVIGVGPGRGISLVLLLGGLFPLLGGVLGFRSRAVREVEDTPWDAVEEVPTSTPVAETGKA